MISIYTVDADFDMIHFVSITLSILLGDINSNLHFNYGILLYTFILKYIGINKKIFIAKFIFIFKMLILDYKYLILFLFIFDHFKFETESATIKLKSSLQNYY